MSDVIKEFLVGLGFRIDDAQWKKFQSGVAQATKEVAGLGKVTVAVGTAIGLTVEKISREYESLYYISQRTNATVSNLKSYSYSMRQIGIDSETSAAQIDSFTTAARLNPGVRGLLGALGVGAGDPKKQIFDTVKSLKERFGESGYFVAARLAQIAGLEEKTFRGMWQNLDRMKDADEDYQRRLRESGVRTEELAEKSTKFQNVLRGVETSIGLVADQTTQKWIPTATSIIEWLDKLGQDFVRQGKTTDGWSSTVYTAVAALGSLRVAAALLPSWLGGGLLAAGTGTVGGLAAGAGLLAYSLYPQRVGDGSAPGPTNQRPATHAELMAEVERRNGRAASPNPGATPAPLGMTPAGTGALGQKLVTVTTQGGKKVTVSEDSAQSILGFLNDLEAGGAPFKSVGGYNPRKIAGTNVWSEHASGRAIDIDQSSRNVVSLAFTKWARENPEVLAAALKKNNIKSGADFSSPDFGHFELGKTPLAPGGSTSAGVTINQTTSINVTGSGDPRATGEAVLNGQTRVNADIVRNTKSAVQ